MAEGMLSRTQRVDNSNKYLPKGLLTLYGAEYSDSHDLAEVFNVQILFGSCTNPSLHRLGAGWWKPLACMCTIAMGTVLL